MAEFWLWYRSVNVVITWLCCVKYFVFRSNHWGCMVYFLGESEIANGSNLYYSVDCTDKFNSGVIQGETLADFLSFGCLKIV